MWTELAYSFQHGDPYVVVIFALAFLGTMIIFERWMMLQFLYNINFEKFLLNLKRMVKAEDFHRAMNFCKATSRSAFPLVALKSLEAADTDPSTVRGVIEEETIKFLPAIEKRLSALPALATLILLTGVLGTIDSLWAAFHSIDVLDTSKKQATLAHGIASSLNPTATGLLVCTILLASHHFLKGLALNVVEKIHYGVSVLSNLLVPQDGPQVVAAMAQTSGPVMTMDSGKDFSQDTAAAKEEKPDDSFNDASVEDIKDEEEII